MFKLTLIGRSQIDPFKNNLFNKYFIGCYFEASEYCSGWEKRLLSHLFSNGFKFWLHYCVAMFQWVGYRIFLWFSFLVVKSEYNKSPHLSGLLWIFCFKLWTLNRVWHRGNAWQFLGIAAAVVFVILCKMT